MVHEVLQEFLLITSTTGVAPSRESDKLIWEANKRMLAKEIATDETSLDKTSVLIMADDWFGK